MPLSMTCITHYVLVMSLTRARVRPEPLSSLRGGSWQGWPATASVIVKTFSRLGVGPR